jgi:hypothetical protein
MTTSSKDTTGERLGRLETEVEGVQSSLRAIGKKLDGLGRVQAEATRTQWSPIIAALAVVVAIMGGLITLGAQGPLETLARHELEFSVDDRREYRDAYADGQRDAKVDALTQAVKVLHKDD